MLDVEDGSDAVLGEDCLHSTADLNRSLVRGDPVEESTVASVQLHNTDIPRLVEPLTLKAKIGLSECQENALRPYLEPVVRLDEALLAEDPRRNKDAPATRALGANDTAGVA